MNKQDKKKARLKAQRVKLKADRLRIVRDVVEYIKVTAHSPPQE